MRPLACSRLHSQLMWFLKPDQGKDSCENGRVRLKVRFKFKQLDAVDSSIYPICYWLE
jgi:hypothetical protein